MKRRRDNDYRGTKLPVDWAHLVYRVRRKQPGALEVLQDAIEEWFPKQFALAKQDAQHLNSVSNNNYAVTFDARLARQRFLRINDARSQKTLSPFRVNSLKSIKTSERPYMPSSVLQEMIDAEGKGFGFESFNKAVVYVTRGKTERKRLRPTYQGSLRRSKIPLIEWEATFDRETAEPETIELFVRNSEKSREWLAKQKKIGIGWRRLPHSAGSVLFTVLPYNDNWVRELRRHGYANRLKRVER